VSAREALLNLYGGDFTSGHQNIYGADADLQLDLAARSSRAKMYLFGGAGWYGEQTYLRQVSLEYGTFCDPYFCGPGYLPILTAAHHEPLAQLVERRDRFGIGDCRPRVVLHRGAVSKHLRVQRQDAVRAHQSGTSFLTPPLRGVRNQQLPPPGLAEGGAPAHACRRPVSLEDQPKQQY